MLMQAVAAAGQELLSSLSGVELSPEESEALTGRLRGAADKKLADLLQVGWPGWGSMAHTAANARGNTASRLCRRCPAPALRPLPHTTPAVPMNTPRAQEAALTRVNKMRDAFNRAFSLDGEGTPRTWRPSENIPAIARAARREAARVLALLVSGACVPACVQQVASRACRQPQALRAQLPSGTRAWPHSLFENTLLRCAGRRTGPQLQGRRRGGGGHHAHGAQGHRRR
jgi:hypothetical protein